MPHPLVSQLRFTRSEFIRAIRGVSEEDAVKRLEPMNCISWNIGHLAWQEQRYFLRYGQDRLVYPDINREFAVGAPASTPPLQRVFTAWREITAATDPWLESLSSADLQRHVVRDGTETDRVYGNLLQRTIYHYWYHTGENMAIRQQLGHTRLPQFVGNIDDKAPYRPDDAQRR